MKMISLIVFFIFLHGPSLKAANPKLSQKSIDWMASQLVEDKLSFELKARLLELVGRDPQAIENLKLAVEQRLQGKSRTAFDQSLERIPLATRHSSVSLGIAGSIRSLFAIGYLFSVRGSLFSLAASASSVPAHQLVLSTATLSIGFLLFLFLRNDITTFLYERPVQKDWKANLNSMNAALTLLRGKPSSSNTIEASRLDLQIEQPEKLEILERDLKTQIQRFIGAGSQNTRLSLLEASYALEEQYIRDKLKPVQPSREFLIFNTMMVVALNWFSYHASIGYDPMPYDSFLESFLKRHPDSYRHILASMIIATFGYQLYKFPPYRKEIKRVLREVPDLSGAEWHYLRKLILETAPAQQTDKLEGPALPETATGLIAQLARMTAASPAILNAKNTPKSFEQLCTLGLSKIKRVLKK